MTKRTAQEGIRDVAYSSSNAVVGRRRDRRHFCQARHRRQGADSDRLSAGAHGSLIVDWVGINRGIQLAVQEINAAGGIDGRQIELITRDTQSDPTKAVNGAAELTRGQKVSVVFGPVNSGESLAVVPLLARTNTPQIHPCWVDALTDPKKYPMCFRKAPTNQQIGGRRQPLCRRRAQAQQGRCDQRHDRVRHRIR
jgi:Periplasmic binding protein